MPQYGDMLAEQLGSQAAGGALGGIMDMIFQPWRNANQLKQNAALQRQQIAGQKEMGEYNYQQQLKMWNATNSEAQMKHLKDAGLNPALMYGGGGAGGTTVGNVPQGNVTGGMGDPKAGGGYSGMNILMPAQIKLMEAQARNLDADTTKKAGVETQNVTANTNMIKLQKEIMEANQNDIIRIMNMTAQKMQQEVFQTQNQTTISDATKQTTIETIKQQYVNTIINGILMKSGIKLNEAQINKMSADIIQRGQEIDIRQFEAEIKANQPSIGEVSGQMLNSIKTAIDKLLGNNKEFVSPRQISK